MDQKLDKVFALDLDINNEFSFLSQILWNFIFNKILYFRDLRPPKTIHRWSRVGVFWDSHQPFDRWATDLKRAGTESLHNGGAVQNSCKSYRQKRRPTWLDRHSEVIIDHNGLNIFIGVGDIILLSLFVLIPDCCLYTFFCKPCRRAKYLEIFPLSIPCLPCRVRLAGHCWERARKQMNNENIAQWLKEEDIVPNLRQLEFFQLIFEEVWVGWTSFSKKA